MVIPCPTDCDTQKLVHRIQEKLHPIADHIAFAEKFGITPEQLIPAIRVSPFISIQDEFQTIEDILELEFTKGITNAMPPV